MNDIEKNKKIIDLYGQESILFNKRDILNKKINNIRADLIKLVSSLYWDTDYTAYELEEITGIPFNKVHLYAEERIFTNKCVICGNTVEYIAKSRSGRDSLNVCNETCSHECLVRLIDLND